MRKQKAVGEKPRPQAVRAAVFHFCKTSSMPGFSQALLVNCRNMVLVKIHEENLASHRYGVGKREGIQKTLQITVNILSIPHQN